MKSRIELLRSLIAFEESVQPILKELSEYGWDSEPLLRVDPQDVANVLDRFINETLTADDVERWADAIESRDDLDFDQATVDVIFALANPLVAGELTRGSARRLRAQLLSGSDK